MGNISDACKHFTKCITFELVVTSGKLEREKKMHIRRLMLMFSPVRHRDGINVQNYCLKMVAIVVVVVVRVYFIFVFSSLIFVHALMDINIDSSLCGLSFSIY